MSIFYGLELVDLKKGDKNTAVGVLQCLLNGRGFDCGSVDNSFGSKTEMAVLEANKAAGKISKVCTIETWKYLINGKMEGFL